MTAEKDNAWVRVASEDELLAGDMIGAEFEGSEIVIYRLDSGEYYATDGICTHGLANLCEGWLEGHVIECPLHGGSFDVRTGDALSAPATVNLRVYPIKVVSGEIFVQRVPKSTT